MPADLSQQWSATFPPSQSVMKGDLVLRSLKQIFILVQLLCALFEIKSGIDP